MNEGVEGVGAHTGEAVTVVTIRVVEGHKRRPGDRRGVEEGYRDERYNELSHGTGRGERTRRECSK